MAKQPASRWSAVSILPGSLGCEAARAAKAESDAQLAMLQKNFDKQMNEAKTDAEKAQARADYERRKADLAQQGAEPAIMLRRAVEDRNLDAVEASGPRRTESIGERKLAEERADVGSDPEHVASREGGTGKSAQRDPD